MPTSVQVSGINTPMRNQDPCLLTSSGDVDQHEVECGPVRDLNHNCQVIRSSQEGGLKQTE